MATCRLCSEPVEDNIDMCDSCQEDNEEAEKTVTYVKCELLAYACTYVNRCTPNAVIQAIAGFYSAEDIMYAYDLLWNTYSDVLDGKTKRRCNAKSGNAYKVVEDIILKGILQLANQDIKTFPFCAVDMTRIPKFSPEEENLQSVLVRVARLEQEMKSVQKGQDDIKQDLSSAINIPKKSDMKSAEIIEMKSDVAACAAAVEWPSLQTPYVSQPPRSYPFRETSKMSVNQKTLADRELQLPDWRGPLKETIAQLTAREEWQLQRAERRKRMRELNSKAKTVIGTQNNPSITSVGPTSTIYLHDIDMEVADKSIKELITGKGVQVKQMIQILGRNNRGFHKSFKITIPQDKFDDVMSGDFWPQGVKCREWIQDNEQ